MGVYTGHSAKIIAIETANPPLKLTQHEIFNNIRNNLKAPEKTISFYKRFLSDDGIATRYFGIDDIGQLYTETQDEAIERFCTVAVDLSVKAIKGVLEKSKLNAGDIDVLIVTTCTGYLCPGLSSYIVEKVGFKTDIFAQDLVGMGCGASIPALRVGYNFIKAAEDVKVMVVCVEVCSASIFFGDAADLILSNSIFSDGASACLLSNETKNLGFELFKFESVLLPQYRDKLRFKIKDSRLRNVLDKEIPDIASNGVKIVFEKLQNGNKNTIKHFAIHSGGRKVLDKIKERLDLGEDDLAASRQILRDYGNMSSASIFYVLENIMKKNKLREGENIALLVFGAGFAVHGALAKWT